MRAGLLSVVLVVTGCGPCAPTKEPPARGIARPDAGGPRSASAQGAPTPPPPRSPAPPALRMKTPPPPLTDESAEEDEPEARNLSAELRRALGGLAGCVAGAAGKVPEVTQVNVTVTVTDTGVVSRASVQAPGWPDEPRRCAERLARQVRLAGPIAGAPRSVTASVTVHGPPPPRPPRPEDEPWQPSSGVAIDDVPGLEPKGPQGKMIDDVPGREPKGPQGKMIDDVPGLEPSGPQGRPPSH
jgi:hypothetical protein